MKIMQFEISAIDTDGVIVYQAKRNVAVGFGQVKTFLNKHLSWLENRYRNEQPSSLLISLTFPKVVATEQSLFDVY